MKLLFLYSTHEFQTEKIMKHILAKLPSTFIVDLININLVKNIKLDDYNGVIIGTSIRYGHYNKNIKKFINKNYSLLNQIPSAFFGVNLTARKPEKSTPETNSYTIKFLKEIKWQPTLKAVFAGALFYPKYNFFNRNLIRFIMWMTKGETDTSIPALEYTNWNKVDEFAHSFSSLLKIDKENQP